LELKFREELPRGMHGHSMGYNPLHQDG